MKMPTIVSGMILYTVGSIVPKVINFVLLPVYTHFLIPAEVGIIGVLQSVNMILAILLTLGFERGIYRLFHDYPSAEDKKLLLGTVSTTVGITSTLLLLGFIAFPEIWGALFKEIKFHPFILMSLISVYLGTFSMVPLILLQVEEKPGKFLGVSVAFSGLKVVLSVFLLTVMEMGVAGVLLADIIANAIMVPYYLMLTFRNGGFLFDTKVFKNCASFSIPFLPGLLSSWALTMSARIFIERNNNLAGVGVYTVSEKISEVLMLVIIGFTRAYNPVFFRIINSGRENSLFLLGAINRVFLVLVVLFGFLLSVWTTQIVELFGSGYEEASTILPILLFAMIIGQMGSVMNNQIYQAKRSGVMSIIVLFSATLSIVLNLFFVKKFGPIGAACTLVCVNIAIFLVEYPAAQKLQYVEYHLKPILISLLGGVGLVLIGKIASRGDVWHQYSVNFLLSIAGIAGIYFANITIFKDIASRKGDLI